MSVYPEWDGFQHVYLEDSYLLCITETVREISLSAEIVLNPPHPNYQPPKSGEQYCYRFGEITFRDIKSYKWIRHSMHPVPNALDETQDYGNIEYFSKSGYIYRLGGEWGDLEIECNIVRLTLTGIDQIE